MVGKKPTLPAAVARLLVLAVPFLTTVYLFTVAALPDATYAQQLLFVAIFSLALLVSFTGAILAWIMGVVIIALIIFFHIWAFLG